MKRDEFEVNLFNRTLFVIANYEVIRPEFDNDCYHVEIEVKAVYDYETDESLTLDEEEIDDVEYQIAKQVMR